MRNIIFLTGMDNCGKDSFIRNYKKEFVNLPIIEFKNDKPPKSKNPKEIEKNTLNIYLNIINSLKDVDCDIIFNRCYIDIYVYSKIYRNYDLLPSINKFENDLEKNNCYLISLVSNNFDELLKREDNYSLHNSNINKMSEEFILHNKAVKQSNLPNKICLNIKNLNVKECYEKINKHFNFKF